MNTESSENTSAIEDSRNIEVEIHEKIYPIMPIKVKQIPSLMAACESFIDAFSGADDIEGTLKSVFFKHSNDMIKAITVASNIPKNIVDELELDELLTLAMAIVEVNMDFFVNRLVPMFQTIPERAEKMKEIAGSIQSKS